MTKRIVLCADDYGQVPSISFGIIDLLAKNRLSATSCLVNCEGWFEQAALLIPFKFQADIGLHFNLTEGKPLSQIFKKTYGDALFSLPMLMLKAGARTLNQAVIAAECEAQILQFREATGFLPRFIDGHQHVHQFPIVREAVLHTYEKHLRKERAYVRLAREKIEIKMLDVLANFKKLTINAMGANVLKKHLVDKNIDHNQSFSGIYTFSQASYYEECFRQFLAAIGDYGIIMCHPGLTSSGENDAIGEARYAEYQYFSSEQFLEDCEAFDVEISRFP